jgi:biopolymer transport protein TolQ
MEGQEIDVTSLGGSVPDFTIWGMFASATLVVQIVMVLLLLASVWSWAIIFTKFKRLKALNAGADVFEDMFWSGNSLEDIAARVGKRPENPLARVFVAAMQEWQKSTTAKKTLAQKASLEERISKIMRLHINRELIQIERHTSFLASVGSVAPFVGLFGTVWGIMNSFQAIALTANTSLAVVAPGIAEALLATALGLVAAIPAVIFYNRIINETSRFAGRMEGFADEFWAFISRQLDERGH